MVAADRSRDYRHRLIADRPLLRYFALITPGGYRHTHYTTPRGYKFDMDLLVIHR